MSKYDELKIKIAQEQKRLNALIGNASEEEVYNVSVELDGMISEFMRLEEK